MKLILNSFLLIGSFMLVKAQSPFEMTHIESFVKTGYLQSTDNGDLEFINKMIFLNMYKKYASQNVSLGLVFKDQSLVFKNTQESLMFNAYETTQKISIYATYTQELKKGWKLVFNLAPQVNSTFKAKLTHNDFLLGGFMHAQKKHYNNPGEFSFGFNYDTSFGSPRFYPLVSYTYYFNEYWKCTVGFPRSKIDYAITENQNISFQIAPQGEYINNSEIISINGLNISQNNKLKLKFLNMGVDYNLNFSENWQMAMGLAYIANSDFKILDSNKQEVYSFNTTESMTVSFSLKYKINKSK
ncbi:DUF6268 family outer membrane beta-barrel protein [Xanthomarina gelatinilytica]|uniref:DUF6268 family outer membrane beta-barrel protein n=1 Tax=Xanthomarina gelatinilytica TaxID=1137281 RepID=UPI003AA81DED